MSTPLHTFGISRQHHACGLAVPVPGPGEVLVKGHATGVCGSDIQTYLWDAYAESITSRLGVSFPFVVGHEYAGTIDKVAPDVQGFAPGDRVSMETHVFCGKCFHCLNGMAHNCTSTGWYGFGYGGSFAEYCIAPARISDILTHRFELNQSEEAFAQMKSGAGKVLFIPNS